MMMFRTIVDMQMTKNKELDNRITKVQMVQWGCTDAECVQMAHGY